MLLTGPVQYFLKVFGDALQGNLLVFMEALTLPARKIYMPSTALTLPAYGSQSSSSHGGF
jgi:hypothetical protein